MADETTEDRRRQAFTALVSLQDGSRGVAESRADVAAAFVLTPAQVSAVEREGLDGGWPPLGE